MLPASSAQLGGGSTAGGTEVELEIPSVPELRFAYVASDGDTAIAATTDGEVYAWGANRDGELGDGTRESSLLPIKVIELEGVKIIQVAAGTSYSTALAEDGSVYTWGYNYEGQLGIGTRERSLIPVKVEALAGEAIVQIDASVNHMVAVTADGRAFSWGRNVFGQLGNGTTSSSLVPVPVTIPVGVSFKRVFLGDAGAVVYAVDEEAVPYGWGYNSDGLIDPTTTENMLEPVKTAALAPREVESVSFGEVDAPSFTQVGLLLRVVSPPHVSGVVDITVVYSSGESMTFPGAFAYGAAPVVTIQPQSVAVDQQFLDSLAPAVFTAGASGDEAPTVVWQSSIDEGGTWSDIPGAVDTTLSVLSRDLVDGTWYRAVFTNSLGQVVSSHAELTVVSDPDPGSAQVSLLISRVGGGGSAGWGIEAVNADPQFNFSRDGGTVTGLVRPSTYALSVTLPSGVSLVALEQLDVGVPVCVDAAGNPGAAPMSCWIKVTAEQQRNYVVAAGGHQVLRLVGATPLGMPSLPITGGVGAFVFVLTAGGLLMVAAVAYMFRIREAVMTHRRS